MAGGPVPDGCRLCPAPALRNRRSGPPSNSCRFAPSAPPAVGVAAPPVADRSRRSHPVPRVALFTSAASTTTIAGPRLSQLRPQRRDPDSTVIIGTANRVAICSRSRSSSSGLAPVSRPACSSRRPWVRRRLSSTRSHQRCSDGHICPRAASCAAPNSVPCHCGRSPSVSISNSRPRCTAPLPPVRTESVPADTACTAALRACGTPPPLPDSAARSCASGSDRQRWRTSAPLWRRRNVSAARRSRFRPHPPRSSSSRTGARVLWLVQWARWLHTLRPYRFTSYAIVTATGTPSPRP